jgi:signal transduction histidine kinase
MIPVQPFKTRARTVDHLGREQIADSPTAVSELWKNAYDAYARSVSLHIFDDAPSATAGIYDDGVGMNRQEFLDRWLVLGTSAKIEEPVPSAADRKGLPVRETQGQKGIGRLSVAFLGPLCLVISRKIGSPYIASLIDWRIFENPYLLLEDVGVPVIEFADRSKIGAIYRDLSEAVVDNVWGRNGTPDRNVRILDAWARFDALERENGIAPLTSNRIVEAVTRAELTSRHLVPFDSWANEAESGTALLVFDLKDELSVWTDLARTPNDDEALGLKENLRRTLTGFVDPYSDGSPEFNYSAVVHNGELEQLIVSPDEQFGRTDLHQLEHFIDGRFDESGIFVGNVRAFGRDLGEFRIAPTQPTRTGATKRVGPFEFCIGTFEQELSKTTHEPAIHTALRQKAENYAGLRVYRDGLRVMPYGRPEVDFFGIEERRTLHAGREFWQHKRVFGRVGLTRIANPNLRDKAGREGLIDNAARRELRHLVVTLLMKSARQYFGSASEFRTQWLPEIEARNNVAKAAEAKIAKVGVRELLTHLREQGPQLDVALNDSKSLATEIREAKRAKNADHIARLSAKVESTVQLRAKFRPPPKPAKLSTKVEDDYRDFRDRYNAFAAVVVSITAEWNAATAEMPDQDRESVIRSALGRHQKFLSDELRKWQQQSKTLLSAEVLRIETRVESDRGAYYSDVAPWLKDAEEKEISIREVLTYLDATREQLSRSLAGYYEPYVKALTKLAAEIDIDSAVVWSVEERATLQERLDQLNSLAQLGVTVEIVGHELETLDLQITRNLKRLPKQIRDSEAFKLAFDAHEALTTRLHFLSPLRMAGAQLKEVIEGTKIADYLFGFFEIQLRESNVNLEITDEFRSFNFIDYSHRIYPVFLNLVNNALYWVKFVTERHIKIDMVGTEVVVADSGRGVDPDDVPHLFELFFTRRVAGRGVGLYLCRANLAASGHSIRYQQGGPLLRGANFIMKFKGASHA